jgi:hypothetical protein
MMMRKLLLILALTGILASSALAVPILTLVPSSSTVNLGNNFTVDLTITSVTDLFGWQLDIGFSPAGRINATSVVEGPFLGAGTTFGSGTINNAAGTITLIFNSLSGFSGVSGSGVLATIQFTAVSVGFVDLSMSNILMQDSFLDPIVPDPTGTVRITVNDPAGIPEPGTLTLIGVGLGMLGLTRRRRIG